MSGLVEKQLQMASPGYRSEDVLYYGPMETKIHDVEVNHLVARTQISGTSSNFNGTCEYIIGSSEVCGYVVLTVQLVVNEANPNVVSSNGWLYSAINQLQWLFGAQSAVQSTIDGWAIADFNHVVALQKVRDIHMWVGGQPINGPGTYSASVLIPMPQSTMMPGKHKVLPIDSGGMSSALIARVTFKRGTDFLSGSDAPLITGFSYNTLNVETFELAQRQQSPYQGLRVNPAMQLDYPFSYLQQMSQVTQGNVLANQPFVITLNGLLNADPLCILFTLTPTTYTQQSLNNATPIAYRSARCKYFELRLNGQIYSKLENGMGALSEALECGSQYDRKISIPVPAADGLFHYPAVFGSRRCPVYVWQSSITRSPVYDRVMMNTRRSPSTLLTLTFMVDDDEPVGCTYLVRWLFIYSSIIVFQAGATTVVL